MGIDEWQKEQEETGNASDSGSKSEPDYANEDKIKKERKKYKHKVKSRIEP